MCVRTLYCEQKELQSLLEPGPYDGEVEVERVKGLYGFVTPIITGFLVEINILSNDGSSEACKDCSALTIAGLCSLFINIHKFSLMNHALSIIIMIVHQITCAA